MLTRAVGIYACLFFALAAVGIVLSLLKTDDGSTPRVAPGLKTLFPMPALVLEFARAGGDVREVITNVDDARVQAKLQKDLRADSLFIALYLLLYVGIALVLGQEGGALRLVLAVAAVACAVGAAAADGVENLAMARAVEIRSAALAVETGAQGSPQAAEAVRASANGTVNIAAPGFVKWALVFVCTGLLSFTFLGRGSVWALCAFCLSVAIAVLGLVGLLVLRANPTEFRPLQLAFSLTLLLTALVGFVLLREPNKFAAVAS
ncbi:MAG TPA: hypothetical protein VFZ44_02345 [Pyrinomonadaceae bacterium]